jgi:hypothetical protein
VRRRRLRFFGDGLEQPSEDGGLLEFLELRFSLASSSAIRASCWAVAF